MLHLVPKASAISLSRTLSQAHKSYQESTLTPKHPFLSDFQEVAPNLFSFYANDTRHDLRHFLLLDIQDIFTPEEAPTLEEDSLVPMLVCDFPAIDGQMLYEKVHGNEYLQGALMTRFYLNILESLLLLCGQWNVCGLILTVDDHCLDAIEVYRKFIVTEAHVFTEKGEQTQVVISTNAKTYDELVDFMEKVEQDFRQTLWRTQKEDLTIRQYLKSHALSEMLS